MERSDAIEHRIHDLLLTYVERVEDLHLWDAINPDWQQRIRRALRIPPDDTPRVACDITILRNGRIGFALTPQGIYWRTPWFAKVASHGFLPWTKFLTLSPEKFQTLAQEEDRGNEVSLAGAAFIFCARDEDALAVRDLLREIHHILYSEGVEAFFPSKEGQTRVESLAAEEPLSAETSQPDSQTSPPGAKSTSEVIQCAYCGRIWLQWEPTCPACGAPLPLPVVRQRQMKKELQQVVFQYLPKIERLKVWEGMGAHTQARIRQIYQVPPEVTPWAFYDATMLESSKRGFVLTPEGVYWLNPWYVSPSGNGFLSWKRAAQIWQHFLPRPEDVSIQLSKGIAVAVLFSEDAEVGAEMFRALAHVLLRYL